MSRVHYPLPEPTAPPVSPLPEIPVIRQLNRGDVAFDFQRGCYWKRNERGGWISLNQSQLRRHLKGAGISPQKQDGSLLSPLDEELTVIEGHFDVHYAAPLAGYISGIHETQEKRVLVTQSANLIRPAPGEWPTVRALIDGLFVDGNIDQRPYLFGWLKVAVEALSQNLRRPGQVLAICGPRDCGKSLFQNIITKLLGDRSAKPYQFMTGATTFNADLFEAEHLMIEDDQSSTDIRARRNFGAKIKEFTVNDTQRCHPKGRQAITLSPFWRVSITVNNEPENLMVLPPLDESLLDKLMLFRAYRRPMPMPTDTNEERAEFLGTLHRELPAFVDFLTGWRIPSDLVGSRFGVTHFHHPEIVEALNQLTPQARLLSLIDAVLFAPGDGTPWSGSAGDLETRLKDVPGSNGDEARKLLNWYNATGVYLGRLSHEIPERVENDRNRNGSRWIIRQPAQNI